MTNKQLFHNWKLCFLILHLFVMYTSCLKTALNNKYQNKIIEIKCTDNCVCDYFRNLRRATCIDKKMLFVKENIPQKTQILEFSYNYLTKIHTYEFHDNELEGLKVLNVSHNRISEIDIFAFESIQELEVLDLSYNALQYVLQEWFWEFTSLRAVYLNHNNLGAFKDVPLFASTTLQVLDLNNCQLPHLYDSTLSEMPSLETIDVSENYLITLRTTMIDHLQNLTEIRLQKNSIKCDNLQELFLYLREMSVEHKTDCQDHESSADVETVSVNGVVREKEQTRRKFDKIIDWSELEQNDNIVTSWKVEEVVTTENKETKCIKEDKYWFESIVENHAYIAISVYVLFGFVVGLTCGCVCRCPKRTKRQRRNIKSMHRVSRSYSFRGGEIQDRELLI